MATKQAMKQRMIRLYKEETGKKEVVMREVAEFMAARGWKMPTPRSAIDLLADELTKAAREEIRHDGKTGRPYRANHAVSTTQGGQQLVFWVDIDEAPRKWMHKSLQQRREQMVGDGLQLSLDADHWNGHHPDEEPIAIDLDITDDVEWRKNAPDEEKQAS